MSAAMPSRIGSCSSPLRRSSRRRRARAAAQAGDGESAEGVGSGSCGRAVYSGRSRTGAFSGSYAGDARARELALGPLLEDHPQPLERRLPLALVVAVRAELAP